MSEQPTSGPGGASDPLLDYAPQHPVQRDYARVGPVQYCGYCGAPLDPFFYFCLRCATPYKQMETITGIVRPAPLSDGQRVQRMAPHTWTVFWTYAWVLIGCAVVTIPWELQSGPSPVLYFVSTLAILVTTVIFACIHWRPLVAQLKSSGFLRWEAWAGVAALVPLLLVNLTEEIAFRGLVQYWLDVSLTPTKALLLGSAMFAGLHVSIISFPYLFCVGAVLALVRRRTGSLYPGMLIHFLHNLVVISLFPLI